MKTFFEDLGKRISETAETVTNKAGEAVEIQKLKNQIRTLERGNENDLVDLGYTVYEKFKDGAEMDEDTAAICEAIRNREESIAEYQQKITILKGECQCASCGKTILKDMAYCPYCGEKRPEGTQAEPTDYAEKAKEKMAEAAEKAKEMAGAASEKAKEMAEVIKEKVAGASESAKEKAENAVEIVEEGVKETADAVEDKVEDAAKAAQEAAQSAEEKIEEM